MIIKFRTGFEKWKYIEDLTEPEVEVTNEFVLTDRLGYSDERLNRDEIEIDLPARENKIKLLDSVQPIDCRGLYTGQVHAVLHDVKPADDLSPKPKTPPFKESGQIMLAITCFKNNQKQHYFTNCECYLLNDQGKTVTRLL